MQSYKYRLIEVCGSMLANMFIHFSATLPIKLCSCYFIGPCLLLTSDHNPILSIDYGILNSKFIPKLYRYETKGVSLSIDLESQTVVNLLTIPIVL